MKLDEEKTKTVMRKNLLKKLMEMNLPESTIKKVTRLLKDMTDEEKEKKAEEILAKLDGQGTETIDMKRTEAEIVNQLSIW